MKRIIATLLILSMATVMVSCSNAPMDAVIPDLTAPEFSEYSFSEDFPQELRVYAAPWTTDARQEAMFDGMIHYYFMSSKNMVMDPKESDPFKWGDSTLIVFPNGQTMLVDVGMAAYAPVLAENLKRMGIRRVDYLMISHPHGDHCGGIIAEESFLDMIEVGTFLYSGIDRGTSSDTTKILYQRFNDRNIPVQIVKQGDMLQFGDVTMSILWPLDGTDGRVITKTATINNNSIVARIDYGAHSSLFVGDLYVAGEIQLVANFGERLDVDLLKVPHHGYATSSSRIFIGTVRPDIAVAMGAYRASIHRLYESAGTYFLFDEYDGYIHVFSDGQTMRYDTDRTGH